LDSQTAPAPLGHRFLKLNDELRRGPRSPLPVSQVKSRTRLVGKAVIAALERTGNPVKWMRSSGDPEPIMLTRAQALPIVRAITWGERSTERSSLLASKLRGRPQDYPEDHPGNYNN
jgi:hypothetical protein